MLLLLLLLGARATGTDDCRSSLFALEGFVRGGFAHRGLNARGVQHVRGLRVRVAVPELGLVTPEGRFLGHALAVGKQACC